MDTLEMNPAVPAQDAPPPAVTQDLAKPLDDAMVRQMMAEADQNSMDVAGSTMDAANALPAGVIDPLKAGTPPAAPIPTQAPKEEVPAKFIKPDGTVDVDKIKASTEHLNQVNQRKQQVVEQVVEKTVDDFVREYKEAERQFRATPSNPEVIKAQVQANLPPPPPIPAAAANVPQVQDLAAIRAQLAQDLNADPIGTIIDIVKSVNQKDLAPIFEERQARKEAERDAAIRSNLAEIVQTDRRILNPQMFEAVKEELRSDPGLMQSRNPHLAAWSIVKGRLRLGEPSSQPAQPGRPPSPILGGGTPPPVPSASGSVTPNALMGAIPQAKSAGELSALEQQIRQLMVQADR